MKTLTRIINHLNCHLAYWMTNGCYRGRLKKYTPQQIEKGNSYLGRVKDVLDNHRNDARHLPALKRFYELSLQSCGECQFVELAKRRLKSKFPNQWKQQRT